MNLKDQVCSLELSKKLKELGVEQESYFVFENTVGQVDQSCWRLIESWRFKENNDTDMECISAFTVAELGEMLPCASMSEKYLTEEDGKNLIAWNCYSTDSSDDRIWGYDDRTIAETEVDVRAKMLVYLIEQGVVTTKQIGKE